MKNKTVLNWTEELIKKEGKYTAGSAVSTVAAVSASLAGFIFSLQVGKKKYINQESQIRSGIEKARILNQELLDLSERDADAFAPVIPLYKLAKNTEEERKIRQEKIDQALIYASKPPYEMLLKLEECLDLYQELIHLQLTGTILEDIKIGLNIAIASIKNAKISSLINIREVSDEKLREKEGKVIQSQYEKSLKKAERLLERATSESERVK